MNAIALDITANNQSRIYGVAFTFTGTEFTTGAGQLKNSDSVASVTLTSAGTAVTAGVAVAVCGSTPSAAVGTGLANYIISYHDASVGLTVNAIALDITADHPEQTTARVTFTGTEFTTGLIKEQRQRSQCDIDQRGYGSDSGSSRIAVCDYAERGSGHRTSRLHNQLSRRQRWSDGERDCVEHHSR